MAQDEPRLLVIALYVRDAVGMGPVGDPALPRLEPAVARTAEPAAAAVEGQWTGWWHHLLASEVDAQSAIAEAGGSQASLRAVARHHMAFGPPGFDGLRDRPELRELVMRHDGDARSWCEERSRELFDLSSAPDRVLLENDVVRETERRLGRRARPFRLQVSVVPVAGDRSWRVAENHVLVTRRRYLDAAAWRSDLEPIIAELA
jgi:hypothetical protein